MRTGEGLQLTFINVGYGESMLLQCQDDSSSNGVFTMVIDGGSGEASEYEDRSSGRVPLVEYLEARDIRRIDLMVCTHIHEDHVSGLVPVAERLECFRFWQTLPPEFYRSVGSLDRQAACTPSQDKFLRALNDYRRLCAIITQKGGQVRKVGAGEGGTLCKGLNWRCLAPDSKAARELKHGYARLFPQGRDKAWLEELDALDAGMNNTSLILRLEYNGFRILLPGDTNRFGYDPIVPEELRADLFKLGHHGQRDSIDRVLLERIRPQVVVCCASSDRRYDSAHPEVIRLLEEEGCRICFSDCPTLGEGRIIPPHTVLEITFGREDRMSAGYR